MLLQDHRVLVYIVGQLIYNVNLGYIGRTHIKTGLRSNNHVKISSGGIQCQLSVVS